MSNLRHIDIILKSSDYEVCLTYPMARFAKLPYDLSKSHAMEAFDHVHIDNWGPYKMIAHANIDFFFYHNR